MSYSEWGQYPENGCKHSQWNLTRLKSLWAQSMLVTVRALIARMNQRDGSSRSPPQAAPGALTNLACWCLHGIHAELHNRFSVKGSQNLTFGGEEGKPWHTLSTVTFCSVHDPAPAPPTPSSWSRALAWHQRLKSKGTTPALLFPRHGIKKRKMANVHLGRRRLFKSCCWVALTLWDARAHKA